MTIDYDAMDSYGRTLLREVANSARDYDKCQAEAAEFQAEQDALIIKRDLMVQKHAAADLRLKYAFDAYNQHLSAMKYAFDAYNQHLSAWKQADYLGHDYTDCDHCANCGAEQYEGDDYYGGCATGHNAKEATQ